MTIRPKKEQAIQLIVKFSPEYVDFFKEFQAYDGGWLVWPEKLLLIKANLKLDNYVLLYNDEKFINNCMVLFLFNKEELEQLRIEYADKTEEETIKEFIQFTDDIISGDTLWIDQMLGKWPSTPDEEMQSRQQYDALDDETKRYVTQKYQYLFLHVLASVHNYFSVMVCGERMTSLVPKAINGDDEAFHKAVKIDRNLLISHPHFKYRYQLAQSSGEREFLQKLSIKQSTPHLIGKIRYPGLYIIFSMLESMNWLDDLKHEEILDICDKAGLDRWQNRVEDVNAVTKQLKRYRNYQKTGGVSMH